MKKSLLSPLIILTLALLPLAPLNAQTNPSAKERIDSLRTHLNSLSSLSFSFTQKTKGQLTGRTRQASGKAYFIKVNGESKMRWNYIAPDTQVIISDGITISMYFEKLKQMIITPAEAMQDDITYIFFSGNGNIEDTFVITSPDEDKKSPSSTVEIAAIKLIPVSPTSQVKDIHIWVTISNEIKRIEVRDNFDTITLLNLSNSEENTLTADNKALQPELFSFTPPEGTEIIRQ